LRETLHWWSILTEPALGNAGPGAAGVWYAAGRRGGVWGGAVPLPSGGLGAEPPEKFLKTTFAEMPF